MDEARIRAWWSHQQGLDGECRDLSARAVLERSGWARSVGGVGPYLTLYSRSGISREGADQAAARLEIHELPAARGCTYVVPASDFALALKVGQDLGQSDLKTAAKLGVTSKEIDRLCAAVVKALARGALDPDQIRESVGGAARSLGEEGKKKGITTTLPLALGQLQLQGEIRRVPTNGRLDQQRYQYTLWQPNPLAAFKLSSGEAYTELARGYFHWIGPATVGEFQWFSGLGAKAARAAIESLGLVPVENDSVRLMFPEERERMLSYKVPTKPQYVMVSSLDAIAAHRRDIKELLDPRDWNREALGDRSTRALSSFADLPDHAILDRGRLVGLWEYDSQSQSIAWASFCPRDKSLSEAIAQTERYVREQLGDARSFSLDSPKSRVPRIEALRKLRA